MYGSEDQAHPSPIRNDVKKSYIPVSTSKDRFTSRGAESTAEHVAKKEHYGNHFALIDEKI